MQPEDFGAGQRSGRDRISRIMWYSTHKRDGRGRHLKRTPPGWDHHLDMGIVKAVKILRDNHIATTECGACRKGGRKPRA